MSMGAAIAVFVTGIALIIKSADFFTDGAEGIARVCGIPRIIIGLTIVSIATTLPEFVVSVLSSSMGAGGLAVGNATGSCLANIGLILAVAAMIRAIKVDKKIITRELPFLLTVIVILYVLAFNGTLTAFEGFILCALLAAFFAYIITRERTSRKSTENIKTPRDAAGRSIFKFFLGAIGVIISAKYAIIPSGITIAHFMGVPEIVIGLSMIAVGTSLPELTTAVIASTKNMGELAVGNVIGANILNILWVLGFSAFASPLPIDRQTRLITLPAVFFITLFLLLFLKKEQKLTRANGLVLFLLYAGFFFYTLVFAYQ